MAGFDNNAITIKGAIAIAALVAGGKLEFTRIAVGDGKLAAGQTPIMMENLVHWLFDVPIHEVRSDSEAQATVLGAFSNKDNETEYYYRELGLFAKDPATGSEILYCYANAGDDAEKIPAAGGSSLLEKEVRIVTLIGNATEVTAQLASGVYATQEMTKAWLSLKADIDATAEEGGRVVASQMRFDASQTLYVDAAAIATGADGTEAKPFKTIQAAVDAAYRGADLIKIEIKPGTYAENVRTPTGTGSSWVFEKNGTGTVSAKSFAIDIAPYVRIEGITLTPDAAGRAIRLVNVAAAAIESNIINGNATGFGVSIFRGSARLNGNRIDNAGTAIYAAEGAQVTSIGTIGEGNTVGLHAEGAIILQHPDANVVATTPFKASNGGAVNVEGGASSFPSSFGQMSSLGSFTTAATLKDRLLSELAKLKAGEWKMFSFQQTISGGFGALGAGQTSHVHMQKTAGEANSYGMLTFFSHASAPVSTMRVSNGAFSDSVPIVLIDETRIATAERYGIMKTATPDVVIDEDVEDAAITPAVYHDVSDFRHKSTAYQVGDRVRCMFDMEKNLECIQAGTTAATPLNTRSVTHGQELPDGSVIWKVRTDFRSLAGNYPDGTGNVTYPIATQAEAEAGEEHTKMMTALRVKQAIDELSPVKTVNDNSPDSNGNAVIPIASEEEAKGGTENTKIMSALRVKQAIDKFAPVKTVNGAAPDESGNVVVEDGVKTVNGEEPDENGNIEVPMGLPLGHLFAWPFQTPPDGAIQCNGATYNRTLYADFYAYANSKGWVKTESEWQSIASSNGGYCPWYSDGDGSTTFRTPKFAPFIQVAIASGSVGTYHQAGLPNIEGDFEIGVMSDSGAYIHGTTLSSSGAFSQGDAVTNSNQAEQWASRRTSYKTHFSAADSNSTYGKSSTVQPESHEWMICVVVMGQATNVRSADVSAVMGAVAQVQASVGTVETEVNAKLDSSTVHIVDTWRSGSEWYRKWSDGWIEQGGHISSVGFYNQQTITFPISFSNTEYSISAGGKDNVNSGDMIWNIMSFRSCTKSSIIMFNGGGNYSASWYACGY